MNIRDIMTQTDQMSAKGKGFFSHTNFLGIGQKGQLVDGVIADVSEQVSIDFNGIAVTVPKTAVQDATEGEIRKFQIVDVSKENIVLKEVGKKADNIPVRSRVSTTVADSTMNYSDMISESSEVTAAKTVANQNLSVLTGSDYQNLEKEEGSLEACQEEYLERVVSRRKEQEALQKLQTEEYAALYKELEENFEAAKDLAEIEEKSRTQLIQLLENSNLPATQENVSKILNALQMSRQASKMSGDTMAYIIGQEKAPTIENIYHGQFAGCDAVKSSLCDEELWIQLAPQIETLVAENQMDSQALQDARWLLANELPVNITNLQKMDVLHQIQNELTPEQVLTQIVQAMTAGNEPEQASLDINQIVIAKKLIQDFAQVSDSAIRSAVVMAGGNLEGVSLRLLNQVKAESSSSQPIPNVIAEGMGEMEIQTVTAKRQLAEICLKMTTQSVSRMAAKGIDVETAGLSTIVKELRDAENAYYKALFMTDGQEISDEELDLMQETLQKTAEIGEAPASLIGKSVRQQTLLTWNELHGAAISETYQRQQFLEVYEQVATTVDKTYGDSIQKAFAGIPEMLNEMGLEVTKANERAVRILGYNSMEVTPENIAVVKECDTTLNRIIDNMKPTVVLEMIREGNNPLNTAIEELDMQLQEKNQEKAPSDEERYSKFLWSLEKENAISEEERKGYIGIYRLLHTIEKTDGAAIGAVLETNREMTLSNLLSAVRTMNQSGMDRQIDDSFGGLEALNKESMSITEQIEQGFASSEKYYEALIHESISEITPSKVVEMYDGDLEKVLNSSVEQFAEKMKILKGNPNIETLYYEEKADQIRQVTEQGTVAREFLETLQIPVTMANLQVTGQMIAQGYQPMKEFFDRRNNLSEEEQQELEQVFEEMSDALGSEEEMSKQCEKAESLMSRVLSESYKEVTNYPQELQSLNLLRQSLQIYPMLNQRKNYSIPIQTGESITTLNVTLIQGTDESGKVQISMEEGIESFGAVSVRISVQGEEIKGLVTCDDRNGYEYLQQQSPVLERKLQEAGFTIKNISYGMNRSRWNEASAVDSKADSSALYKIAKICVKHITDVATK